MAGTTAVGVSAALVFGHATNTAADTSRVDLAAAVIGVGGQGDATGANIPAKLQPNVWPQPAYPDYVGVLYPASYFIDNSVAAGLPVLHQDIKDYQANNPGSPTILVVGYSEGTIVAEDERRNLANSTIPTNELSFLMIASPNVPNGGIFGRFPGLNLLIVSSNGPAQPSKYDTAYVTNEYDPYADFPAYFNPLSLANSAAAVYYVHPDRYYDDVNLNAPGVLKKEVDNSAGGHDTYYFIPAQHLPLLQLPRDISSAVGLTPFTEPFIGGIEPIMFVLVDMGYTDRENLNPETPTSFSLITPPAKIGEAIGAMPGAIAQGAGNFAGGVTSATPTSTPVSTAWKPASSPSVPSLSTPQLAQQPSGGTPQQSNSQTNPSSNPSESTPTSATPGPKIGPLSQLSPFALGKNTAAQNETNGTASTAKPGGQLATAVSGALTSLLGGKPKPATSESDTASPAQGKPGNAA